MSPQPEKQKKIQFRLKNVEIPECSFRKPERRVTEKHAFGFRFSFGVKFHAEDQNIVIETGADVYYSPKQRIELGRILSRFTFHVTNYRDFVDGENNPKFPKDFIVNLISISYSTLRGIIIERSASTLPVPVVLPVINVINVLEAAPKRKK